MVVVLVRSTRRKKERIREEIGDREGHSSVLAAAPSLEEDEVKEVGYPTVVK